MIDYDSKNVLDSDLVMTNDVLLSLKSVWVTLILFDNIKLWYHKIDY